MTEDRNDWHSLPDLEGLTSLLSRYQLAGPRYTSYPTAPVWRDDFGENDFRRALGRVDTADAAGLSLYAHVPFCRSLCHFCACNRVITRDALLPERYLETLRREIDAIREALNGSPVASQLHLGGGTPTHLSPTQLTRLMGMLQDAIPRAEGAEVSIEVDPRVTSNSHVAALEECGFNRISLGVQDFDPKVQAAIRRIQPVDQVAHLVGLLRRSGFESVNFDLIYGLPYQTAQSFEHTLDAVFDLAPDRVALYSYAHVTWVAKQQRGFERHDLPSGAVKLEILLMAIRRFLEAGYVQIGIDHFAHPDDDLAKAASAGNLRRNFMGYSTRATGALIAFGPSGISELSEGFAQSVRALPAWEARVEQTGFATMRGHFLSEDDRRRAWVIEQIMCRASASAAAYATRFDRSFAADYRAEITALGPMEEDNLVRRDRDGGFSITPRGRVLVRNIAMVFDAYLPAQQRGGTRLFSQTV